jgi:peptidoglycan/LPS O-acetylase OafA/YrhL
LYAPISAWRSIPGPARRLWLWLSAFAWAWIVICAIRAGGSQWDNPRYRLIFFAIEALVAGYAWVWWRDHRDAWLPRILALESLCVLLFGQWYLARYNRVGIHLPIMLVLGLSLAIVVLIVAGGWLWDRRKAEKTCA